VLAVVLVLAGGGLSACGGEEDDNARAPFDPVELPDIRGAEDIDDPYRGLLDAAFREDLDAWDDIEVTLLAEVADVLSPQVFTVTSPEDDQVDPVLVVATRAAADVDVQPGSALLIAATPDKDFDAEAAVTELDLDVEADDLEEWDDDAVLVATVLEPAG
jgi:hypothetical protein